jgi:hypothetical protein
VGQAPACPWQALACQPISSRVLSERCGTKLSSDEGYHAHLPRVCLVDVMAHPDETRISESRPKRSAIVRHSSSIARTALYYRRAMELEARNDSRFLWSRASPRGDFYVAKKLHVAFVDWLSCSRNWHRCSDHRQGSDCALSRHGSRSGANAGLRASQGSVQKLGG